MWLERYLIIIPTLSEPRLPYERGAYTPSWVEWSMMAGLSAGFILAILLPTGVSALVTYNGGEVLIDHPVQDDVFATGGTVTIDAPIASLIAAGGMVNINAPVSGDVIVAGGTVNIGANIGGNVMGGYGKGLRTAAGRDINTGQGFGPLGQRVSRTSGVIIKVNRTGMLAARWIHIRCSTW
jgi:hypothetical protein